MLAFHLRKFIYYPAYGIQRKKPNHPALVVQTFNIRS